MDYNLTTFARYIEKIMSYIIVFVLIAFVGTIAEALASRHPYMQRQIYYCTFFLVALWGVLKYAVGPDIASYLPFYREIPSPQTALSHLSESRFEPGFTLFCSVLHSWGVSFWWMTAIIAVFYYAVIFCLFKRLKAYHTLALMALVALDYNLMFAEFRQCLAVTFFYFFILLLEKKQYVWAIMMALLSCTMHKSAVIILILFGLLYLVGKVPVDKRWYILLGVLIIGLILIPLQPLLVKVVETLPLSASQIASAKHHLLVGKPFQRILIVYLASIFCLAYYLAPKEGNARKHWLVWCGIAIVVCLYPYWFLLNRLRSYFLPFLIIYIANTLYTSERKDQLTKQVYAFVLVLYTGVLLLGFPAEAKRLKYPTMNISLVTERFKYSQEVLEKRQLDQAELYWTCDYQEMIKRGEQMR